MGKIYLSDVISNQEISTWEPGDNILISSPTGSGKSHFILKTLLPQAIKEGKHILYLCNRKILSEQIQVDAKTQLSEFFGDCPNISEEHLHAIHIVTYQYCETTSRFPRLPISLSEASKMDLTPENTLFYIFDEAHYFSCDALFNSGTCFWVNKIPTDGINIFLTATPAPLLFFLAACQPKFRFEDQLQQILAAYKEKAALRRKLLAENQVSSVVVNLKKKIPPYRIDEAPLRTKREIDNECREITPYAQTLELITHLQSTLKIKTLPYTPLPNDYRKISTYYFRDYIDIFKQIQKTPDSEKWIVFVDKERDGLELATRLDQEGIHAVLISKTTLRKRGNAQTTFTSIVKDNSFSCTVLIATEVLDCGVSITDPAVKHIVLAHHRKTTFLQMVGRRRLSDHDALNLYIRHYSAKEIYGILHQLDLKMRLLVKFALRNSYDYVQTHRPRYNTDGMREVPLLSDREKNQVIADIFKNQNAALIHHVPLKFDSKRLDEIQRYARGKNDVLEEYEYSKTTFIGILYEMSDYMAALENSNDSCFYLKRQLSWLGKEYDETNWINYEERTNDLLEYLAAKSGVWMNKEAQQAFSAKCLNLLLKLPVPPKSLKQNASRYSIAEGNLPGLKVLRQAFREKEIPYVIQAKQKYMPTKTTCWCVTET